MPLPTSLLFVEDHTLLRETFVKLYSEQHPNCRVSSAADGLETLEILKTNEFDLVLLDIRMPLLDGIQTLQVIRNLPLKKQPKILMLTSLLNSSILRNAIELGADGYASKMIHPKELDAAMSKVMSGGMFLDANLLDVPDNIIFVRRPLIQIPESTLTNQQRNVIRLMCEGLSFEQIAVRLGVSIKTFYVHWDNIRKTLSEDDLFDILVFALVNEIIALDEVRLWKKGKKIDIW